ncbi:hypothetical protein JXM67_14095 [candidate division WOR-3 bacterium]|nr:hypothetical protein [candidate division WOR-3 bacterium]
MGFLKWLAKIDRRIIFLVLALVVLVPLLVKIPIPPKVSEPVENAYRAIDTLRPGSVVVLSVDYDATSAPECQPMMEAIAEHAFRRGLKIILLGHLVTGLPLGQIAIEEAAARHGKTYGTDYVNLGYRPNPITVIVGIGREIRDFYGADYQGVPVDSFPMMRDVHNYDDIAALVSFAHGTMVEIWIEYAWGRFGEQIIGGVTGVVAPNLYPYLQSKQLVGLLGGLKGASEYESLLERPGLGSKGMPAQTTAHLLIILFILVGTVADFIVDVYTRRKK